MTKSLYDISWQVTEEEYRADPAYSYSTIARYEREGFSKLDKLFEKIDTPSLVFGSMVDTLLTDGEEAFNDRFAVMDLPDISDKVMAIIKGLWNLYHDKYRKLELIDKEIISQACVSHDYYVDSKWKALRVKNILEGAEYYTLLFLAEGKTIVSSKDYEDAAGCVRALKEDRVTGKYFAANNPFDNIDRQYQLKFKGEFEGISLRCMADLIIIDYDNKIIIPVDLKTSSKPEYDFYKSFIDWSYFIQASLYHYIMKQNIEKDPFFKDFVLKDYRFIVINRFRKHPLVWEYPLTQAITDLKFGELNNIKCRNWRTIVKELDYYLKNKPINPIGIKDINNIVEWLNKM